MALTPEALKAARDRFFEQGIPRSICRVERTLLKTVLEPIRLNVLAQVDT